LQRDFRSFLVYQADRAKSERPSCSRQNSYFNLQHHARYNQSADLHGQIRSRTGARYSLSRCGSGNSALGLFLPIRGWLRCVESTISCLVSAQ
jgi:hypothetical protein